MPPRRKVRRNCWSRSCGFVSRSHSAGEGGGHTGFMWRPLTDGMFDVTLRKSSCGRSGTQIRIFDSSVADALRSRHRCFAGRAERS
jgi:hypothetical protein